MIVQDRLITTSDQPILKQILKPLRLNYTRFAKRLEIDVTTLERYRCGERQLRLNTRQIKIMIELLSEVGLTFSDLPDDWIIEKPPNN